ncbi:MAG: hypothetical protein AAF517_09180, partial [Planctomycetota bacterium]
ASTGRRERPTVVRTESSVTEKKLANRLMKIAAVLLAAYVLSYTVLRLQSVLVRSQYHPAGIGMGPTEIEIVAVPDGPEGPSSSARFAAVIYAPLRFVEGTLWSVQN